MADIRITQRKSGIGGTERQRETLKTLGLRRIGATVTREDRPEVRGMVRAVAHLVQVVRMREHECPVGERQNVELEHVAAELDRELERLQRVLRRERGRAAMPDARELAGRPAKLNHAERFTPLV